MQTLTDDNFLKVVGEGLSAFEEKQKATERNQETLLKNVDNLDKSTKKSLETLEILKNSSGDLSKKVQTIEKLQLQLRQEAVTAGIDPVQRITRDERKRAIFNYVVRASMCDNDAEFKHFVSPCLKAIGEDTGEGSTLIIAQLFKEIYDTLAEYGEWSTLGVRRLGTKVTNFPVKTARPIATWLTSEAATINDDANEAGSTLSITVLPLAVLLNVSRQLIEDAEFDVTSMVMHDFQEAWNLGMDTAAFVGTGAGAGTDGNFTGVFNGGLASVAGLGNVTVSGMNFDDVNRCLLTVAPVVLKRSPEWWMHPQMLARIMGIKDSLGRPIFMGALDAPAYGKLGTILGFPVNLPMACPNTDGAGVQVAAFGDPNGQVVGIRDDFVFESSDHFRWNTLQRSFRAYGRAGTITRAANAFAVLQTAPR